MKDRFETRTTERIMPQVVSTELTFAPPDEPGAKGIFPIEETGTEYIVIQYATPITNGFLEFNPVTLVVNPIGATMYEVADVARRGAELFTREIGLPHVVKLIMDFEQWDEQWPRTIHKDDFTNPDAVLYRDGDGKVQSCVPAAESEGAK